MLPGDRQEFILRWLREEGSVSIDHLSELLGISAMTVHRDVAALAQNGLVVKVHGGVTLAEPTQTGKRTSEGCDLCDLALQARTSFVIQLRNENVISACCPHCGFLLLQDRQEVVSALAKDFLYSRTINAAEAVYVLESSVTVCCTPSTLCFATRKDAQRFSRGFGGIVMSFAETESFLSKRHNNIHLQP